MQRRNSSALNYPKWLADRCKEHKLKHPFSQGRRARNDILTCIDTDRNPTTPINLPVMLPVAHTAIIEDENGAPVLAHNIPLPPLKPGTLMVKIVAIALNPADYKMGAAFPTPGAIIGSDFSGIVFSIHPATQTDFSIGDRVCGTVHGSNPGDPTNGSFAEYVRLRPEFLLRVPQTMLMEEAATLGVGLMTNVLALWDPTTLALSATLDSPAEKPFPVLVYGGSTATGTLAIQFLRLAGLEPIVTCSPQNFDLVRERGAVCEIDYMQPDGVEIVKSRTGGKLKHAYDCIADPSSVAFCYKAIGRTGGRYVSLELVPEELRTRQAVHARFILGYEGLGENVTLSKGYDRLADPAKVALVVKTYRALQKYLDNGTIKTHPIQKLEGGLASILQGFQLLKSGSISGRKLVAVL